MATHTGMETMANESICGNFGCVMGAAGPEDEEGPNGRTLRARGSVMEKTKEARKSAR